mmetsp:Transcript_14669/g.50975  ORF Transcript_14669/g.50975 Transcript_14669/m.50975 type:complete len:465 (+) Transcript_14669:3116-4510(+)
MLAREAAHGQQRRREPFGRVGRVRLGRVVKAQVRDGRSLVEDALVAAAGAEEARGSDARRAHDHVDDARPRADAAIRQSHRNRKEVAARQRRRAAVLLGDASAEIRGPAAAPQQRERRLRAFVAEDVRGEAAGPRAPVLGERGQGPDEAELVRLADGPHARERAQRRGEGRRERDGRRVPGRAAPGEVARRRRHGPRLAHGGKGPGNEALEVVQRRRRDDAELHVRGVVVVVVHSVERGHRGGVAAAQRLGVAPGKSAERVAIRRRPRHELVEARAVLADGLAELGLDGLDLALDGVGPHERVDEELGEDVQGLCEGAREDLEVVVRRLDVRVRVRAAAVLGDEGVVVVFVLEFLRTHEQHVLQEVRAALRVRRVGPRPDADGHRRRRPRRPAAALLPGPIAVVAAAAAVVVVAFLVVVLVVRRLVGRRLRRLGLGVSSRVGGLGLLLFRLGSFLVVLELPQKF